MFAVVNGFVNLTVFVSFCMLVESSVEASVYSELPLLCFGCLIQNYTQKIIFDALYHGSQKFLAHPTVLYARFRRRIFLKFKC